MTAMRSVVAGALLSIGVSGGTSAASDPTAQPRLEHMAIWAESVDRSAKFLHDTLGWKLHPMVSGVPDDNPVYGGMDPRFVDASGLWLELVQPTTAGPGTDFMEEKGNGAIVERDFFVQGFDRNVALMKARGIDLIGMDGKPMVGDGLLQEYVMVDGRRAVADERLSYLPFDLAQATSLEMGWEYPDGDVYVRDAQWSPALATPKHSPRLDHVVVLAQDLEASAKAYSYALRSPRHDLATGLRRDWVGVTEEGHAWLQGNTQGFWIGIVTPQRNRNGTAAVQRFGDGNIMELVAELQDTGASYDRMQQLGITMTVGDDRPSPRGKKPLTMRRTGDRHACFPLNRSEAMRSVVTQRGSGSSSVNHLRDRR